MGERTLKNPWGIYQASGHFLTNTEKVKTSAFYQGLLIDTQSIQRLFSEFVRIMALEDYA